MDHDPEWDGGYYQLAICLGPRDDARVAAAVTTLADGAGIGASIDGRSLCTDGDAKRRVALPFATERPPQAADDVACVIGLVRESDAEDTENSGDDWLDLSIPLGSLARVEGRVGAYPFDSPDDAGRSLAWRAPLDAWFVDIARAVDVVQPFRFAVIGFNVSGEWPPLSEAGTAAAERHVTWLVRHGGALRVLPANR